MNAPCPTVHQPTGEPGADRDADVFDSWLTFHANHDTTGRAQESIVEFQPLVLGSRAISLTVPIHVPQ